MILAQTSKAGKGKASHKHHVYHDDVLGGLTSVVNDHSHEVSPKSDATPAVTDPITGIELHPGTPGGPSVSPAGKDNHTHNIEPLTEDEPVVKKKDEDLVAENRELYRIGVAIEGPSFKLAEVSEEFFMGQQWNHADKSALEAESRAALTINECESKIDLLSGYQRQNRSDFRFLPTEDGDSRVADILNIVVKNVCDQNDWEFSETDIFDDGTITGRGNIHAYVDYTDSVQGDIKLEHFPWRDVKYGPHNKKDGSDCEFIVKAKWYSRDKVIAMFPDKKDEIMVDWEIYPGTSTNSVSTTDYPMVGSEPTVVTQMNDINAVADMTSFVSISKKEYLLIEIERKEYTAVPVVFNQADNFYKNCTGLGKGSIKSIQSIPGMDSMTQVVTRIRRTTTCGNVLLRDNYLEDSDFSLIPFYAKKRGNRYWGKIEGIKDLQLEINKRHSQSIDIVNRMAAYGWFYDDDTFQSKETETAFTLGASKPGFKLKIADIAKPPHMTEGVKFPTELSQMMQIDSQKIKEMMNINMEMAGMARSSQSGVAIVEQKRQGLVGNEFLFDNLNFSKKRLGRKIIRMIAKTYTPERMLRILNSQQKPVQPAEVPGQPGSAGPPQEQQGKYNTQEILELLKNDDLTNYDVVVTESQFNPTNRLANFMIWSDLAGKGAPIPIMSLVDMSDAPDKDKMKADIKAEMDRQAQTEQNKNQTEISKTKIAHGISQDTQSPGIPSPGSGKPSIPSRG